MNDHLHPLFQSIVNTTIGQPVEIKLNRMPDTHTFNREQVEALNKLLDLQHDLLHEVDDPRRLERYERRHRLILDKLFPERVKFRGDGE